MDPLLDFGSADLLAYALAALPLAFAVALVTLAIVMLRSFAVRSIADNATRYRVRKALAYVGTFIVALLLLSAFSAKIAQLSVIIGAIGAGVAFALQEVIASVAGWVALSFGGFYKPGDRVELGGIRGDVIDIGILRTTLMETGAWINGDQYNGRIVRVANSHVFKEPVFNYSGEFHFLWDEFTVPISYGCEWREAQRVIEAAARAHVADYTKQSQEAWSKIVQRFVLEQAELEPQVTLRMTDDWIEFTVRYITDYRTRRSVRDRIMRSILDGIEASGDRIRLGSETVEIVRLVKKDRDA